MKKMSIKCLWLFCLEPSFYSFFNFVKMNKIFSLISSVRSVVTVEKYLGEYYEKA